MNVMMDMGRDGLTAQQRTEVYRRQMLVERDRLEMMHANLQIIPPDEQDDIAKALALRLDAGELAATDGLMQGQVDDFLVAHFDPDDDDDPIILSTWSDLASSIIDEDADSAALARLAEIGIEQTQLRAIMARKSVHQARLEAIKDFRKVLLNPSLAYPKVPVAGFTAQDAGIMPVYSAASTSISNSAHAPQSDASWVKMTPTEAVEKFFHHNPKTGGSDGQSRRNAGGAWTPKTREQLTIGNEKSQVRVKTITRSYQRPSATFNLRWVFLKYEWINERPQCCRVLTGSFGWHVVESGLSAFGAGSLAQTP